MGRQDPVPPTRGLAEQDREGILERARLRQGHWLDAVFQKATVRGDLVDLPGKGKLLRMEDPEPYGGLEACYRARP